jgi:hypothetical protein
VPVTVTCNDADTRAGAIDTNSAQVDACDDARVGVVPTTVTPTPNIDQAAEHRAMLDQRFLDGILFARYLTERLLAEEFLASPASP